jgi:hypothetical protein
LGGAIGFIGMKKIIIITMLLFSSNGWTDNSDYQCINAKKNLPPMNHADVGEVFKKTIKK